MKATIDEKGCLIVEAETSLEAYALKKWFEEFKPGEPGGCKSMLMIDHKVKEPT